MAAPTYQATGTLVHGTTAAVSPVWPTHQTGDVAFLITESPGPRNVTLTVPAGFVPLTYGLGTAQSNGTRLTVWWCRATSSAMSAPSVQAASDHIAAAIVTVRGAYTDGDPVEVFAYTNKLTASTSVTFPSIITATNDSLVLNIGARDNDAAGAAFSSATNASLSSVAEGLDDGTTDGNGGGLFTVSGTLATAGSSGTTTGTITSSANMLITLGIRSKAATGIYMRQRALSGIYGADTTAVLPANTLPGSLIVVDISQYNIDPAVSDFSDTQTNTYAAVNPAINDNDVDHLFMCYAKNIVGGAYTLNIGGNSTGGTVVVTEYVGVDTVSPLDQVGTNGSAGSTTSAVSVTTTIDNELYHVITTDANDDFITYTPTTGFNAGVQQGDITNWMRFAQADSIQAYGTITGGFTMSASATWCAIIATFKPGAPPMTKSNFFQFF